MGVQIAELAGGLLQLALAGAVLLLVAEVGCRIFFKWYEREGKGEAKDYCQDCGQVEWLCICE
jgi:hypothetical protein